MKTLIVNISGKETEIVLPPIKEGKIIMIITMMLLSPLAVIAFIVLSILKPTTARQLLDISKWREARDVLIALYYMYLLKHSGQGI